MTEMLLVIGSGKTFVAAEFIRRGLKTKSKQFDDDAATVVTTGTGSICTKSSDDKSLAALFLVPTCDLAVQQKRAIQAWVGNDYTTVEYMGGKAAPTKQFDVLVSTPQAFLTLQQSELKLFDWSNFFCCIFDEVHHALKEHPYRIIAHRVKAWISSNRQRIQVVGLSASLTYAVGHRAVEQALVNLCDDLDVTVMISPTSEELVAGGYTPQDDTIETMQKPWQVPKGVLDGKRKCLALLKHHISHLSSFIISESQRKPHLMHEIFIRRIETEEATEFAMKTYKVVKAIESEVVSITGETFESPINDIRLGRWAEAAYKKKEKAHPCSAGETIYKLLEVWYVALRLVCQSWEEEEQFVLQWLIIQDGFQIEGWYGPKLISS